MKRRGGGGLRCGGRLKGKGIVIAPLGLIPCPREQAGCASPAFIATFALVSAFTHVTARASPNGTPTNTEESTPPNAVTFKLLSAFRANRIEEGFPYYPALQGETADIPSRFRTEHRGRLLLAHPKLQFELQERSEISISTTILWQQGNYLSRFLTFKRPSQGSPSPLAPSLTLHRGAILVQTCEQPVSIHAGKVSFEASSALFSLSTSYVQGQRLSVTKGAVKVIKSDHSIVFVPSGQTLTTDSDPTVQSGGRDNPPPASELPQRLSLLGQASAPLTLGAAQPPTQTQTPRGHEIRPGSSFADVETDPPPQISASPNLPAAPH